ncbi:MAG: hypothetical protein WC357_03070, partial [Candidatus Omnitrophota bacterium]
MAYTIRTPSGQGYQMEAPDEGKLFKGTDGQIYTIQSGKVSVLTPEQALADKYGLGSIASTGNQPATKWNEWLASQGLTTGGAVKTRAYSELGIDPNKLPEYSLPDLAQYGIATNYNNQFKWWENQLSYDDFQKLYSGGNIATEAKGPTEIFGADIPKEISGVGGPKDLQGNLITPADYAKYGITDTKPAAPVTYVNGVAQPAPGAPGASGEAPQTGTQPQYQILNVEAMGKYKPTD